MRQRIPDWIWLLVGMTAGLMAVRWALAPRILAHEPSPGTSVPATAEIRITFDQPMDEASVLERLHVDPYQAAEISWQGTSLILGPQPAWPSGSEVEVRLDAGARSRRGVGMLIGAHWSFEVSPPRLAYLWPADGPAQIYTRILAEGEAVQLTDMPDGVTDFSIGARGTRVVYVAESGDGSTELRELNLVGGQDQLLFTCPAEERCASAELSPDGGRLAFVRDTAGSEGDRRAASRVWILEVGDDTAVPVSPEGDVASAPLWSPGGWLSFVDSTRGAILVVDVNRGERFDPLGAVPSALGERGCWSPDGNRMVYPDLLPAPSGSSQGTESLAGMETHLFGWDVSSGALIDLTAVGGWQAEDVSAVFTSDGEWIVFSRRLLSQGGWTSGRQLWRMRPDGSQAERLTDKAFINHGAPAVAHQGAVIAYLRFNLETPSEPAQIWSFDPEARTGDLVIEGGYLPAWIP